MKTIRIALPDDVISALENEAKSMGVSIDAVASIFFFFYLTHTLHVETSLPANR